MALINEDGTAKVDAESFCSVAFSDSYHESRGLVSWLDLDESAKETALRKATDFLEAHYTTRWKGVRFNGVQALAWPRSLVIIEGYDVLETTIPVQLMRATAELAAKTTLGDELDPDVGRTVVSEKVGEIAVTYDPYGPKRTIYSAIDAMLNPLLRSGSSVMVKLLRV